MRSQDSFLAITMGDAAGIGPEIILQSLAAYYPKCSHPVVIGSYQIFQRAIEAVKCPLTLKQISDLDAGDYRPGVANILDTEEPTAAQAPFGRVSKCAGIGSVAAIRRAYELSFTRRLKAIISAPLHKQAMKEAGFSFADECELMADLTGATLPIMLLISEKLRMATVFPLHVSLKEACSNVSASRILSSLQVLHESLVTFGIPKPKLAVAALNPHAGEGGSLGNEEVREIIPAIEEARRSGLDAVGPFPADSLFFKASNGQFDAVLTMYHDQGRIAMKTMDFGRIIIVMVGVPVPFVTVAHGTAHDIAGKGAADPSNFTQALQFADGIS